jgi:uncharacterized protein
MANEQALAFDCGGQTLVGILHRPAQALPRGVLVVVGGGPQYRAGGHRQLTLWSRRLAAVGYPVLRFDYRGMGDAQGDFQGFLAVDEDIGCAVDRFCTEVPELREVVLWGECDGASAILLYAARDPRVKGVVLLNPWVRTEALQAQTVLRHYYLQRLLQPSLWKKLLSGQFDLMGSWRSALGLLRKARQAGASTRPGADPAASGQAISRDLPLTDSLLLGLQRFDGHVLLVMSGRDFIAREFDQLVQASPAWQQALADRHAVRHDLPEGDHTFSSAVLRGQVIDWGVDWLRRW